VYGKVLPGNPKMILVEGAEKGAETARHHFSVDRTLALPHMDKAREKSPVAQARGHPDTIPFTSRKLLASRGTGRDNRARVFLRCRISPFRCFFRFQRMKTISRICVSKSSDVIGVEAHLFAADLASSTHGCILVAAPYYAEQLLSMNDPGSGRFEIKYPPSKM
jgi:hypothetical protein